MNKIFKVKEIEASLYDVNVSCVSFLFIAALKNENKLKITP